MQISRVSTATLLVLFTLAAGDALAGGEPRTHDGFFLRLSTGLGMAGSSLDASGGSFEVDNQASGDANFAIGGTVAPNLILHATMWGWILDEPDVTIGPGSGKYDGFIAMNAFGGGLTYYVMPANVYFSGSVGFGKITLDGGSIEGDTDNGFAMDMTIGKEWWVGDSWGLGIAGGFSYHSVPDDVVDSNWSGVGYALRFTATLN
jgi:hypothetical protein